MTLSLKEFKQILLTNSTNGREDLFTIFYKNGETAVIHLPNKFGIKSIIKSDEGDYCTITFLNGETLDVAAPGIEEYMTNNPSFARYGVTGIGESASAFTRCYESVGMVAMVGTDGDNSDVVNDFDNALPFMWKKCVGSWSKVDGKAVFTVAKYLGEDGYTEDGSIGDYVAVEVPLSYFFFDGNKLIVSAHKYDGFRAFDIFCIDHDQENLLDKIYLPAYAMGLDDNGYGASLPGLDNDQGSYHELLTNARKYKNGELGTLAILEWSSLQWYFYCMFTVEFAQQNAESVMRGCTSLRHNNADTCVFQDATHVLLNNWNAARVVGEYIAIIGSDVDVNDVSKKATHRIKSIVRCDSSGTASSSGTYSLLEIEDLGTGGTYDTTGATTYRCAARPWRTGSCNTVSTPSGYIGANDGYHPMRYRYIENIYGNQYSTVMDFFSKRVGTGDSDYYLEHYLLKDPGSYTPSSSSKPDATDLASDKFEKLTVETKHENYTDGYIVSKEYDPKYPDLWIPKKTSGGSATTFFCDYAYLVSSTVVRARRVRGLWTSGATAGPSFVYLYSAPSTGSAYFGGCLCIAQNRG